MENNLYNVYEINLNKGNIEESLTGYILLQQERFIGTLRNAAETRNVTPLESDIIIYGEYIFRDKIKFSTYGFFKNKNEYVNIHVPGDVEYEYITRIPEQYDISTEIFAQLQSPNNLLIIKPFVVNKYDSVQIDIYEEFLHLMESFPRVCNFGNKYSGPRFIKKMKRIDELPF